MADIIKTDRPHVSVIFITSYKEFALQAYEIGGLDYVLKPISHARLEKLFLVLSMNIPFSKCLKSFENYVKRTML